MRRHNEKCIAFLITLIPVLLFAAIERTFYDSTASAKENNKKQMKKKQKKKSASIKMEKKSSIKEIEEPKTQDVFTGIQLGDKSANNKLVLFTSLSCSTCRRLHDKVLNKIIETYPNLNVCVDFYIETAGALEAIKMINMPGLSEKTKLSIVEAYFHKQSDIEEKKPEKQTEEVRNIAAKLGLDAKSIQNVSADKDLAKVIVSHFKKMSSMVKSQYLPAVVVNNETYPGEISSFDDIKKFIEENIK